MRRIGTLSVVLVLSGLPSCGTGGSSTTNSAVLAGNWDIVTTQGSSTSMGSLSWSASTISFSLGDLATTLTLDDSGAGVGHWSSSADTLTVRRHGGSMDTGAIPFNLGGSWDFWGTSNPRDKCTAILSSSSFSTTCGRDDGHVEFSLAAQRTARADSIFGDFGGTWTFQSNGEQCTAKLVDNTITVTCSRNGRASGSLMVMVSADKVSGSTSDGFEFTAQRK